MNNINRHLTVLVVDDEIELLETLQFGLHRVYDKVLIAKNGIEAKEVIESGIDIDVIVTDLNMPDMCGVDLINWIKTTYERFIPIVVTSGHSNISERYLDTGCIEVLDKPVDVRELVFVVDKLAKIRQEMCKTKENLAKLENVYSEAKKLMDVIKGRKE